MFTFGIFSTHIPYLIFLGFYLSYFLFSYQFSDKEDNLDELALAKKHICCDIKVSQEDHCAYYVDFLKVSDSPIVSDSENGIPTFIPQFKIIPGPGDRLNLAYFVSLTGLVVNRPPPVCV